MLKIYHARNTRGIRLIWLCEELAIPYEVENIDFSVEYRRTPEFRAISPLGKVPIMLDGDIKIFESGAMVQYVLQRYANGRLQPTYDDPQYPLFLQWMWFAEATASRPLGEIVNHGREFPGEQRLDNVVSEMANRGADSLVAIADYVEDKQYLINDTFSAADIMIGYTIMLGDLLIADQVPAHIQPYWQRLQERPAYQKAISA